MLNFKKVFKEGSNEKSFLSGKKKKDQENYENKVKDFLSPVLKGVYRLMTLWGNLPKNLKMLLGH